jgi:3-hydroxyisobutyrate dehydrogenase
MDSRSTPTVGFIGLGAMGWPMAACIAKAGYRVAPYDVREAQRTRFLKEIGGIDLASLAEIGAQCDVIIDILPNSDVVDQVLFGDGGLAATMRRGTTVIDMTSGRPDATVGFAERLAQQGVRLFDAPVSGGVPRATSGELTIMAGGERAAIDDMMPVLKAMGTVMFTGPIGSGHAMKSLNNLVSAGGFLIGIEALLIGTRFGIDPDNMVDILNASTGVNNSTQKKFKQYVISRGFNSGFSIELMVKDLVIALDIGRQRGVSTPFASLCRDLWGGAAAMLGPQTDHTAVAQLCERLAGMEIHRS